MPGQTSSSCFWHLVLPVRGHWWRGGYYTSTHMATTARRLCKAAGSCHASVSPCAYGSCVPAGHARLRAVVHQASRVRCGQLRGTIASRDHTQAGKQKLHIRPLLHGTYRSRAGCRGLCGAEGYPAGTTSLGEKELIGSAVIQHYTGQGARKDKGPPPTDLPSSTACMPRHVQRTSGISFPP